MERKRERISKQASGREGGRGRGREYIFIRYVSAATKHCRLAWPQFSFPLRVKLPLPPSGPGSVFFNDLYRFDPAAASWTALSPAGTTPTPRFSFGFTATLDGMVYLFGGQSDGGVEERWREWKMRVIEGLEE